MARLKTAWQLAMERCIAPSYDKRPPDADINYEEFEMPEMVSDWKAPYEQDEQEDVVLETGKPTNDTSLLKEVNMQPRQVTHYDNQIPQVHWQGDFTAYTGFGKINRALSFGLANRNVAVCPDLIDTKQEINNATRDEISKMEKYHISPSAPKVYSSVMPANYHEGKSIAYTVLESPSAHPDFVTKLNCFNEIWVPTEFARHQLEKGGVKPKIYTIPCGVDSSRYIPGLKPFAFGSMKKFVFLSVFQWGARKGGDILLKSFMEEYSAQDDVTLLLVSRTSGNLSDEILINDFKNIRSTVDKKDQDLPHITLYNKPIREKDMPRVYAAADAFVLISRGEGFCLPYCESACCGLPVIGSYCTGQTDYLNNNNSYLVHPDGIVKANNHSQLAGCSFYEEQEFADFSETGIQQTRQQLREVQNNYKQAQEKTDLLRNKVLHDYTWDNAIDRVYQRILEMQ